MSKNTYYKDIFNNTSDVDLSPFDLNSIYSNYLKNNLTTKFEYDYFDKFLVPDDKEIIIDLEVNIPYQERISYIPTYLTTFKEAWIQYFCLMVPLVIVMRILFYFLLSSGVFKSFNYEENSQNNEKFKKSKLE
jgi:hypothetical protein